MVACPNQQSGSNPTRARFVLNRVELSFFLCISMIISILEQSSCCQLKMLYTTLQETNLHKHQKNNHKPVGFF